MPQPRSVVHPSLLETLNWLDTDDARVHRLLSRLRSSNQALEGLSRALETSDAPARDPAQHELS